MTDTMTPSEIADWLDIEANTIGHIPMLAGDAPHIRQAAAAIRAQAEALKIATEALEEVYDWLSLACIASADDMAQGFSDKFATVGQALARIKEVG